MASTLSMSISNNVTGNESRDAFKSFSDDGEGEEGTNNNKTTTDESSVDGEDLATVVKDVKSSPPHSDDSQSTKELPAKVAKKVSDENLDSEQDHEVSDVEPEKKEDKNGKDKDTSEENINDVDNEEVNKEDDDHPMSEEEAKSSLSSKVKETKKKGGGGKKRKADLKEKPAVKKPKVTSSRRITDEAAIGDIDTSLAEQVKSDGLRRERKQVDRFVPPAPKEKEKAAAIPEGRGTKLSEIPYIAAMIEKRKGADLSNLHRLCFGRKGTTHEIKKNLRQFSGFTFDAESKEFLSKKTSMIKWHMPDLKEISDVLGLKRAASRELMVDAILNFCLEPDESNVEKQLPKEKKSPKGSRKKSSTGGGKRGRKSKESSKAEGSSKKGSTKRKHSVDETPDSEGHASDSDNSDVTPKKKKKKVAAPLPPRTPPSREVPSRHAASGKRYVEDDEDEGSDSEDIEAVEKAKKSKKPLPKEFTSDISSDESDKDSEEDKKKKKGSTTSKKQADVKGKSSNHKDSKSNPKEKPGTSKSKHFTAPKKVVSESEHEDSHKSSDEDDDEKIKPKKSTSKPSKKSSDEDEDNVKEKKSSKSKPDLKKFDSNSDAEDEPDVKGRSSKSPTDSQLKLAVKETVESSDLKKVTMKMMVEMVCSKFPEANLESKKSFIKSAVKDLL